MAQVRHEYRLFLHEKFNTEASLMKKICFLIVLILFIWSAQPAQAEMKKLGQAGMTFLSIGGSARAAGMANVFDWAQNDLATVFYNPAGLATVENRAFFFNYTQWIADMSVSNMAISWNTGDYGVFALHAQLMDYGDFNGTAIANNDLGYVDIDVGDVSAMSIGIGYGIKLTDLFAIGGNIKLVSQKLGKNDTYVGNQLETGGKTNEVSDVAFDFGTSFNTGFRSLMLTMSIRNYAGQQLYENEEFQLPQTYKIGVAADLWQVFESAPAEDHTALLAIEGVDPHDRPEYVNFGLEYGMMHMLSLRLGWSTSQAADGLGGFGAGAGFKLDTGAFVGNVDVSYSDYGSILGEVLRFSLSGSF
jgi:hypothetical protein